MKEKKKDLSSNRGGLGRKSSLSEGNHVIRGGHLRVKNVVQEEEKRKIRRQNHENLELWRDVQTMGEGGEMRLLTKIAFRGLRLEF